MSRRLIPPGLTCVACRRPFAGTLSPTDRVIVTDLGLVHAEGCTPLTKREAGVLSGYDHQVRAAVLTLDRVEDLEWMDQHGESLDGAAARLGMQRDGLALWLRRRHQHALLERLRSRDTQTNPVRERAA